ncbi:MAG: hypothetical protein ACLFVO_22555, partial [Chloroflexaceae bacterium]
QGGTGHPFSQKCGSQSHIFVKKIKKRTMLPQANRVFIGSNARFECRPRTSWFIVCSPPGKNISTTHYLEAIPNEKLGKPRTTNNTPATLWHHRSMLEEHDNAHGCAPGMPGV